MTMPGISLVLRCNNISNVEDTHLVHITTQMYFDGQWVLLKLINGK